MTTANYPKPCLFSVHEARTLLKDDLAALAAKGNPAALFVYGVDLLAKSSADLREMGLDYIRTAANKDLFEAECYLAMRSVGDKKDSAVIKILSDYKAFCEGRQPSTPLLPTGPVRLIKKNEL